MSQDHKFTGWVGADANSINGNLEWKSFEPKPWEERDVDIEISHCGVCASDLHTLRSGWGPSLYPIVVGHEIVGRAVRVGSQVKHVKVGDVVGVGAQNDSCLGRKGKCRECETDNEQYCQIAKIDTYNAEHFNGGRAMGGYATHHRAPGHFVMKIPEGLEPELAAPMLCGGVTVYSPLKRNGCGPGKRVGIVGVGGLGHFGVLFAKALGADEVVGVSRKSSKRDEVLKLGADRYIATDDDKGWAEKNARSLDLIICTVSSPKMPYRDYFQLLAVGGKIIQVGVPEGALPSLMPFDIILPGCYLGGSAIGSPAEINEMLQLAADKGVKPWVETRSMKDANKVVADMEAGKARFRYCLVN